MNKRKIFGAIIGLFLYAACIFFFTYAFYNWRSSNTLVNIGISDNHTKIEFETGPDVNATNIGPVLNYNDGVETIFGITKVSEDNVAINIKLDISSISENLKDETFKYVLLRGNASGTSYTEEIVSGNFTNLDVGSNFIIENYAITSEIDVLVNYKFIVYIDGNMKNDINMQENSLESILTIEEVPIEVVINFNGNGGEVTTTNKGANVGETIGTLPTPTQKGYSFTGWYTAATGGEQVTEESIIESEENITLYARWSPYTYNINYTLNNGTEGSSAPATATFGEAVTISNPTKTITVTGNANSSGATVGSATSKAQTFAGWTSTTIDTTTAYYGSTAWTNGSTKVTATSFKNLTPTNNGTVTLIANWSGAIPLPTATKTGYTCTWNTAANGSGTSYTQGGSYTPSNTSATSITMYAICSINTYTVTIGRNDTGYGTVSSASVTVPYGTTYSVSGGTLTFSDGQKVTASANSQTAQYNYGFSNWSSTSGTITSNTTITANFSRETRSYTVTIGKNNDTYGTLSSSSVSIPYGTTYTTSGATLTFSNGTTVTASPTSGYILNSWSPSSGTITSATTITANFVANSYTVTIAVKESGYGSVSATNLTVSSGATYSVSGGTLTFSDGTTVTATPTTQTAQYSYSFSSWSSTSGTITSNTTITANFSRSTRSYAVTIGRNNTGYGTVSSSSITVAYGTTYSVSGATLTFSDGQKVTATAATTTAQYSYSFSSWSSTSGTITGATTINANFSRSTRSYAVTIGRNNTGYGTVSSASVTVPYGTTYSVSGATLTFSDGQKVTASATSATGYNTSFSSWSSTSGTITGATTITANFSRSAISYTVTIGRNNTSYGTVSSASVSIPYGTTYSTSGATLTFSNGTKVTASATAATGYTTTLSSWSPSSGTITGATTITANFTRTGIAYTWVSNYAGSGATLTVTGTTSNIYNMSFPQSTLNFDGWQDDDESIPFSFTWKTNSVSTRGLKYMTIFFYNCGQGSSGLGYIRIMSSSGTELAKYTDQQLYQVTKKIDVSSASSVYLDGYGHSWSQTQGPGVHIQTISFSN